MFSAQSTVGDTGNLFSTPVPEQYKGVNKKAATTKQGTGIVSDVLEKSRALLNPLNPVTSIVQEPQHVSIIQDNGRFYPERVSLKRGVPAKVYLTNSVDRNLAFILEDYEIKESVSLGRITVVNFVPQKEGVFKFYCPINHAAGYFVVQ
jgi:plastocyanin domain-containing protein